MAQNESRKHFPPFEEGAYYHIYNRGNNGDAIFSSDRNRDFFYRRMTRYLAPYVEIVAWVFMGNHFHLLIKVKEINHAFVSAVCREGTQHAGRFLAKHEIHPFLIDQFKRWLNSYAKAYNKEQSRTGSLFEKRFRRLKVEHVNYAENLIAYIHNNPVHHGFVEDPRDWKYSSFRENLNKSNSLIDMDKSLKNHEMINFENWEL